MSSIAATSYMDETELKSVWAHADIDDTRFGYVGVLFAEVLNLWLNDDESTNITNTAVANTLKHLCHEAFIKLEMAAKATGVTNPWDFMMANASNVMVDFIQDRMLLLKRMKKILNGTMTIATRELDFDLRTYNR